MNQYETVFILTPVLSDVQMKEEGSGREVQSYPDKGRCRDHQRRKLGIEEVGLSNPEEIYRFLSVT